MHMSGYIYRGRYIYTAGDIIDISECTCMYMYMYILLEIYACLYDRCVGVQGHHHWLHISCSTVKTYK